MRFLLRAAVIVSVAAGVSAIATAANARDGHHARARGHLELRDHHSYVDAGAVAVGSPGLLSGNVIQVPIDVPVNVCGNTINIIAALNPAFGNTCVNVSAHSSSSGHEFRSNIHGR